MCGRTACALAPDQICRAARHRTANGKWAQPGWRDPPGGQKYYTSYNIAPTSHTPVMISKKHTGDTPEWESMSHDSECEKSEYVIQPMLWGLVPSWHKGDPKAVSYKMNNARSDGMLQKKSFKGPLEKGRRCVVLVEGYYEWHTSDTGKKQPYFITLPPAAETKCQVKQEIKQEPMDQEIKQEVKQEIDTDLKTEIREEIDANQQKVKAEGHDFKCDQDEPPKPLLAMAGIFDVWHPKEGDGPLYSYSIITVDAHKSLSFIHHRMPAILNGEEEIMAWLNFEAVSLDKAVELIHGKDCLHFYPVSSLVNKVQNKSEECIKPVDLSKPKKSKSSMFMAGWLAKAKTPSPKKNIAVEIKKEHTPEKSPKKANLMLNWLNKAVSPQKDEKENGEPSAKKSRPNENH